MGQIAARLGDSLGLEQDQVMLSCLEFIEPDPDQALEVLAEGPVSHVTLLPLLLGSGKHATLEMEEVVERLRSKAPSLDIYLAGGLGPDPLMADLIVERVQGIPSPPIPANANGRAAGVLLVKAGTKSMYDDCIWLKELGQSVEDRLGPRYAVEVAQSHYGDPTMEDAAGRLVAQRGVSSITCVPYLFFPGLILQRNILGGMAQLQHDYPDLPMTATPPLGADQRVVEVAAQRVREVWAQAAG